jgi:dTDP-4-amino-4,6-dideoxygalactose transaminase
MSEKLALRGGTPVKSHPFPTWPQYDENEEKALIDVLHSRIWWRTPGKQTLEFEERFAAYQEAKYGIACTNGTAALEIAVAALGIGLGDEVIVPDFTFIATASAVLTVGAMPVLVDVDPNTYCIDPEKVEALITPRTKAIIAVHIAGHPADMDRLQEIARIHNLSIIEDSSHAHGSEWKGKKIGAIGSIGTFSFQSSKLMTAGEGGLLVTNNEDLAIRIRSIHDCGRMPGQYFYSHYINGSNYRLSEWQGAVLNQQLNRLDEQAALRTPNATYLNKHLLEIDGIRPQVLDIRVTRHGYYCYIFHYDKSAFAGLDTKSFIKALNAEGIPTQDSYPAVRKLDVFQNGEFRRRLSPDHARESFPFLKAECPITDDAAENTVWLVHRALLGSQKDTEDIVTAIKKIQRHAKELASA